MTYSLNPGSSVGYLDGEYRNENNEWILTTKSKEMKIIDNNILIGFNNQIDSIKMNKIER